MTTDHLQRLMSCPVHHQGGGLVANREGEHHSEDLTARGPWEVLRGPAFCSSGSDRMLGIVVVTQGNLAREFVSALEHVAGPQECVRSASAPMTT